MLQRYVLEYLLGFATCYEEGYGESNLKLMGKTKDGEKVNRKDYCGTIAKSCRGCPVRKKTFCERSSWLTMVRRKDTIAMDELSLLTN